MVPRHKIVCNWRSSNTKLFVQAKEQTAIAKGVTFLAQQMGLELTGMGNVRQNVQIVSMWQDRA